MTEGEGGKIGITSSSRKNSLKAKGCRMDLQMLAAGFGRFYSKLKNI